MVDPLVIAELNAAATRVASQMLRQVLDQADDALFDLAQKHCGRRAEQGYLDAMRELRKQRSGIVMACQARLQGDFEGLTRPQPARVDVATLDPAALSLLGVDVLEEQLAGEQTARAVETRHADGFRRLQQGVARLLSRDPAKIELPFGPLSLSRGLAEAIRPVITATESRLVLLKLFERVMLNDYATMVEAVERTLTAKGIRVRDTGPALLRPLLHRSPTASSGQDEGVAGRGRYASLADSAEIQLNPALPAASQRQADWVQQEATGIPDDLFAAMLRMFSQYLGGPQSSSGSEQAQRPTHEDELSTVQVLRWLEDLQASLPDSLLQAADDRQAELGERLKAELLLRAGRAGGGRTPLRFAAAEDQGLTLVGMLFDVLLDQNELIPTARARFVRLILPYARVALLDRRLFAQKTHPARQVLNALAEACDGNRGETPMERELLDKVFGFIDRLEDDRGQQPTLFAEIERALEQVLEQHRRRASLAERRAAEAQRGRERLEEARATAAMQLAALTGGRAVPAVIGSFLRDVWTHHLTLVVLREGEDSAAYRSAAQNGIRLWLSLLEAEQGTLSASLEAVLALIAPALQAQGQESAAPAQAEAIHRALQWRVEQNAEAVSHNPTAGYADALDSAPELASIDAVSAAEVIEVPRAPAALSEDIDLPIADGAYADDDLARIRTLRVGDWVELVDAQGQRQAAKLSWISPISNKMLFVNRRGVRLCALTAEEMAAMMCQNTLSLRDVDSAFERAMTQMLGRLQQQTKTATASVEQRRSA